MDKRFLDENARFENPDNPIIPQILILMANAARKPSADDDDRRIFPPNPFAKRYNERESPAH